MSSTDAGQSLLAIALSLLIILALLGNSLVLVVLLCRARRLLNKPLYVFICNICLSDVIATLFTMTFEVVEELTHEWRFGEPACKVIEYLEMTLFGVNIFTHFSIAIERYRNVVQPLKVPMKLRTARKLVAISWCVPSAMSLPYLYTLRLVKEDDGKSICTSTAIPSPWLDKLFLIAELVAIFLIPLVCVVWMYVTIVRRLYQRKAQANVVMPQPTHTTMRAAATQGSRVSIAVVSVFLICWLPFIVVYMIRLFVGTESVTRTSPLYVFALYSSFVSELLTPLLYCAFDRNIKPALKSMLRCGARGVMPYEDSVSHSTPRNRFGALVQPTCDIRSRDGSSAN